MEGSDCHHINALRLSLLKGAQSDNMCFHLRYAMEQFMIYAKKVEPEHNQALDLPFSL